MNQIFFNENSQQVVTSNPSDRGKQDISHPSKEKYRYLPQTYEEVDSSLHGLFGNSEQIEGFLVGGKQKLQEIRRELEYYSNSSRLGKTAEKDNGIGESHDNAIGGPVLSSDSSLVAKRKKVFTLWDVDIYEEDVGNTSEDLESSHGKSAWTRIISREEWVDHDQPVNQLIYILIYIVGFSVIVWTFKNLR